MFQVGFSERIITPADLEKGVSLAGIRKDKDRIARRKLDDLLVRVAWFRSQRDFILVNADLICFSFELCEELKAWVEQRWGIEKRCLMINATHTHSSPHLGDLQDGGTAHPGYREFLVDNLRKGIEEALQDLKPASLSFGRVLSGLCVNRRKRVWALSKRGKPFVKRVTVNRPNRRETADDELSVIKVLRQGKDIAFLMSMGCHPNLVNGPVITSDFPGRIRPSLEERMKKPVMFFFLQGFGGDVRPDVLTPKPSFWTNPKGWTVETIEGRSFEKQATEAKLKEVGKYLADKILSIPPEGYKEISGGIEVSEREVRLPLQSVSPDGGPVSDGNEGEQNSLVRDLKQGAYVSIGIKKIRMGKELSLIAIPGEVFCEYSLRIKSLFAPEAVIPLGCTDGMVGYLPTQKDFHEGGYEPGRAYKLFGLQAPFTDEIERVILEGVNELKASSSQG